MLFPMLLQANIEEKTLGETTLPWGKGHHLKEAGLDWVVTLGLAGTLLFLKSELLQLFLFLDQLWVWHIDFHKCCLIHMLAMWLAGHLSKSQPWADGVLCNTKA